jgi:hypothetical protein
MKSHPSCFTLLLFTFLFTLGYSGKAQDLPEELLSWKGTWYTVNKQDTLFESWNLEADGSLRGESWTVKSNKDSIHSEYLRLYTKEKNIIYESIVKAQHGDKPVSFSMILQTSSYWIFYNEENDFPKFISYKRLSENQMKAVISNSDSPDPTNSVEFNFTKYPR